MRKGFTLIEVAVVLVVLGILAAIAIPSFNAFMNGVDESTAEKEALAFVANAASVSAFDGYRYQSDPATPADATAFNAALEQVDSESGADDSGDFLDYTNVENDLTGEITVRGSRDTYSFTVDLLTGEVAPAVAPGGGGGGGSGGGGTVFPPTIAFSQDNNSNAPLQGLDFQIDEEGSDLSSVTATLDVDGSPVSGSLTTSGSGTAQTYRFEWLKSSGLTVNRFYTVNYSYVLDGNTVTGSRTAYLSDDITDEFTSVAMSEGGASVTLTGNFNDPDPVTSWDVYVFCSHVDNSASFMARGYGYAPESASIQVPLTSGAVGAAGTYECQVILSDSALTFKALYGYPTFAHS